MQKSNLEVLPASLFFKLMFINIQFLMESYFQDIVFSFHAFCDAVH